VPTHPDTEDDRVAERERTLQSAHVSGDFPLAEASPCQHTTPRGVRHVNAGSLSAG
jgi:hypothetical protein